MNDRMTKLILLAIAMGLWANAAVTVVHPASARPEPTVLENYLSDIAQALMAISSGQCANHKLCG
jgi:hypothetical protein